MYISKEIPICWQLVLLTGMISCSRGPSRVEVPDFNPDEIGAQAIEGFDKDGDGSLSAEECKMVQSLGGSLKRLDKDGDEKISAQEIAARINFYHEFRAALVPTTCTLIQKGRPVAEAKVTYEPEKFMGPHALPAYGLTSDLGRALISIDEEHRQSPAHRGAQPGFYRIRVTLANGEDATDLNAGVECSGDQMNDHTVVFGSTGVQAGQGR
jgi:hypothetical protein